MPDFLPPQPPKQSRSRRTLERIVRASLDILAEQGPDAMTVQAIVGRAGSSVGSFYARFAGKEELLAYLGERGWREAALRWDEALASQDLARLGLGELVEVSVRLLGDAAYSRAAYLGSLRRAQDAGHDAYAAFREHVVAGLEKLLLAHVEEMSHPEPEVAVRLGLEALMAILEERGDAAREQVIPRARRMEEATRFLLAYLAGGPTAGGGTAPGQVDFFDIWG